MVEQWIAELSRLHFHPSRNVDVIVLFYLIDLFIFHGGRFYLYCVAFFPRPFYFLGRCNLFSIGLNHGYTHYGYGASMENRSLKYCPFTFRQIRPFFSAPTKYPCCRLFVLSRFSWVHPYGMRIPALIQCKFTGLSTDTLAQWDECRYCLTLRPPGLGSITVCP